MIDANNHPPIYKEYRCKQCAKLLFKGLLIESEVEIKCRGCHELTVFTGEPINAFVCLREHCPNRVRIAV